MRRFTIAPDRVDGVRVTFDPDETRHLARVLRLRPGDVVVAGDGHGRDYTIRVETLGARATGTVLATASTVTESPLAITLVQGIPKGDKLEAIIRAATELGVRAVQPVIAARTVVRLDPSRWRERTRRWQRVAREAAKQCGRAVVPEVGVPSALRAWLDAAPPGGLRLFLWEGRAPALDEALAGRETPESVAVLVGPEGGWEPEEVEDARRLGWSPVGLGPRILRTETAGPAIVAILQHRYGDMGRVGNTTT